MIGISHDTWIYGIPQLLILCWLLQVFAWLRCRDYGWMRLLYLSYQNWIFFLHFSLSSPISFPFPRIFFSYSIFSVSSPVPCSASSYFPVFERFPWNDKWFSFSSYFCFVNLRIITGPKCSKGSLSVWPFVSEIVSWGVPSRKFFDHWTEV